MTNGQALLDALSEKFTDVSEGPSSEDVTIILVDDNPIEVNTDWYEASYN